MTDDVSKAYQHGYEDGLNEGRSEGKTPDEIAALAERVVKQVEWSICMGEPRDRTLAYVAEILAESEGWK